MSSGAFESAEVERYSTVMTDATTQLASPHKLLPLEIPAGLAWDETATGEQILHRARARVQVEKPGYAGVVTPQEAWALADSGIATLVDVRPPEERQFAGYISKSVHVPWSFGPALQRNPRFLRDLESWVTREQRLLFLCRTGSQSAAAARAATEARYQHAFNVLEGFEGELDAAQPRRTLAGWKSRGLPWIHD